MTASTALTVQVNGKNRTLPSRQMLPEALAVWAFNPRLVVVEYNGEILHRQFWAQTQIDDGDRLEVVTIVGGG
ncbi:MAG: sulfur carrier protein ThiS [Cyanobacteria bacterium P01_H01_bin.15]